MTYTRTNGLTSWYLRVRANGSRHLITLGTEMDGWSDARARIELQNVLARIQAGIWEPPREARPERTEETFHQFASAWLARRKPALKPRTYESYRYLLTNHLLPTFAPLRLRQIDYEAIERYVEAKQFENDEILAAEAAGAPMLDAAGRPRRTLANSTINATLELLNLVLDNAVRRKLVPANPGRERGLRLKEQRRRRNVLEIDELEDLLAAAQEIDQPTTPHVLELAERVVEQRRCGKKWKQIAKDLGVAESTAIYYLRQAEASQRPSPRRTIIACFAGAGPRNSELCAISIRDVDLRHRHIDVPDAKTPTGVRRIDLSPKLHTQLKAWRETLGDRDPDDPFFATRAGTRRDKDNINARVLRPAVARANARRAERGLLPLPDNVTPHTLRRTYISMMFAAGAEIPYVMDQVGHADSKVTLEIYAQVLKRRDRKKIGEAFDRLLGDDETGDPDHPESG